MKLRRGERIVCTKGHHVGDVTADVPDHDPVRSDALSISGPLLPGAGQGYVCGQCDEVVALRENDEQWRVRTSRGWIE